MAWWRNLRGIHEMRGGILVEVAGRLGTAAVVMVLLPASTLVPSAAERCSSEGAAARGGMRWWQATGAEERQAGLASEHQEVVGGGC